MNVFKEFKLYKDKIQLIKNDKLLMMGYDEDFFTVNIKKASELTYDKNKRININSKKETYVAIVD